MYNIVTVTDDKYLMGTAVMLQSLYNTTKTSHGSNVFILYDKDYLSIQSMNSLTDIFKEKFSIFFCTSSLYEKNKNIYEDSFKNSYLNNGWNFSVLLQMFVADAMPEEVKKIHYVDSDTIFINDAVDFLNFELSMPIAAQVDPGVGSQNENPVQPYFNAGVYITDLNYWKDKEILKNINLENVQSSVFHAQNFLNQTFKNNWQILGPQINVTRERIGLEDYINNSDIQEKHNFMFNKNPILVHYFGQPKPWTEDYYKTINNNWRSLGKVIWIDDYYQSILNDIKNAK